MARDDKNIIYIVGALAAGYAVYKIGGGVSTAIEETGRGLRESFSGIGSGISGLGQGFGGGVFELGSGVGQGIKGLGMGVGSGVELLGGGFYQIGTGAGTFLGGAAPANIIQSFRENPDYFRLASAYDDLTKRYLKETGTQISQPIQAANLTPFSESKLAEDLNKAGVDIVSSNVFTSQTNGGVAKSAAVRSTNVLDAKPSQPAQNVTLPATIRLATTPLTLTKAAVTAPIKIASFAVEKTKSLLRRVF